MTRKMQQTQIGNEDTQNGYVIVFLIYGGAVGFLLGYLFHMMING